MPTNEKNAELNTVALQIFAQRAASGRRGMGERDAFDAFRSAEMFLNVQRRIASGEPKSSKAEGPQLADIFAVNLPATSPFNLVARLHTDRSGRQTPGDLAKVSRIHAWLCKNVEKPDDPEELVARLNQAFPELGWTMAELNTARATFGAYVTN